MEKILIKYLYDLAIIVSYISAGDVCNKWIQDLDFENNLDATLLLWDKDGVPCRITCGILCNSNPSCRSFFYHPSLMKCMGSQSYKRGLPSGQLVQKEWEYYTRSQQCDRGYTFNKTLGLCYKIHPETKTWQEAMDACEAEEAKLIIIRNEMEFVHVRDALKAAGPLILAMNGLRKILVDGIKTWKYWNGQSPSYLDWEPGEPDNYLGDENCGNFVTDPCCQYKFDDVNCLWRNSFICQKYISL
ncbi:hypothetical protein ACJMK2_001644 [Sinanodonta woodiana]|uniref:C-type lectin domain-containing protein n=1 Tax=Sinanodonta woodiana TaxID=1069815 RepID=A0ABD3XW95_SINWO